MVYVEYNYYIHFYGESKLYMILEMTKYTRKIYEPLYLC